MNLLEYGLHVLRSRDIRPDECAFGWVAGAEVIPVDANDARLLAEERDRRPANATGSACDKYRSSHPVTLCGRLRK